MHPGISIRPRATQAGRLSRARLSLATAILAASLAADEPPSPALLAPASALNDPHRFENIFALFRTEAASLSPDGRHIAYSLLEQGTLHVVVVAIDAPEKFRIKVAVNSVEAAQPGFSRTDLRLKEAVPPQIHWIGWISPTRVVLLTGWGNGPSLMSFDADGTNARVLATTRTLATLGGYRFFGRSTEPDSVLIRTRRPPIPHAIIPKVTFLYSRLNTVTGEFTDIDEEVALEEERRVKLAAKAAADGWQAATDDVSDVVPDKKVTMLENDDAHVRFLALVEGFSDPGSFCVLDRRRRVMFDLVRRIPDFDPSQAAPSVPFEFTAADGQKVTGEIALPRQPRTNHAPLVVIMPEKPGQKVNHAFSREAQAFAEMGLASVRFDSFARRQSPDEPERVQERWLVDEIVRLIDGLPALHAVSKRSVVLYGENNAGYLALRAMQIQPERFIAAVVAEPAVSPERWNARERWPENAGKPGGPSGLKRPLLVLTTSVTPLRNQYVLRDLVRDTRRGQVTAELAEQPLDFRLQRPLARAAGFRAIEDFINANVYQYVVKLRDLEILPDTAPPRT